MAQKPQTDTFTREFRQDAPLAVDDRTVSLAFSSTEPYQRAWYDESSGRSILVNEVLEHEGRAVDLTRLKSGAPLLRDHDTRAHIGAVVSDSVTIDGTRGRAKVKFSRTPPGEAALMDVNDDILRSVSVAYRVLKTRLEDKEAPVPTLRVTKWQPYEISLVAVPADSTVGVGRNMEEPMNDETTVAAPDKPATRAATPQQAPAVVNEPVNIEAEIEKRSARQVAEQLERINKINAIADQFKDRVPEIKQRAKAAIDSKEPAHAFSEWVLGQLGSRAEATSASPTIGMSRREQERFSFVEAVRGIASGDRKIIDKYADITRATAQVGGINATSERGFLIPQDVMERDDPEMAKAVRQYQAKRALVTETGGAGGYLVGTELLTGSMIELLRNASALASLPCTRLTGLVGNIDIPKQTGGGTAYWLSETATLTRADQAFGQLALTPKRVSAATAFSRQLVAQASLSVEAMVRSDLATVIAISKDSKYLTGAGGAGEPMGLVNVSGIGSVTYGGAPVWGDLVDHEKAVEDANVRITSGAFLISPVTKAKWKQTVVVSGVARFLYDEGTANGYPVIVSKQVPATDKSVFGNWSDFVIAEWAAMEVIVDPYSLSLQNQISLVLVSHTDCAVRYPEAFVVSSDSAAQ